MKRKNYYFSPERLEGNLKYENDQKRASSYSKYLVQFLVMGPPSFPLLCPHNLKLTVHSFLPVPVAEFLFYCKLLIHIRTADRQKRENVIFDFSLQEKRICCQYEMLLIAIIYFFIGWILLFLGTFLSFVCFVVFRFENNGMSKKRLAFSTPSLRRTNLK